MDALRRLFLAAALILSPLTPSLASDLSGRWRLDIQNSKHAVVATLTVRFTNEPAFSCLAIYSHKTQEKVQWHRLEVESQTSRDSNFFPAADPLAFTLDEGTLTMGRVEVCDGYELLEGLLASRPMAGRYFRLGLGGKRDRGFFKLIKLS